ncbi:hypothetical protein [Paraburkholderia ribeironis]|nr:hypothetical protein [Paraburkholderia ribeironis]
MLIIPVVVPEASINCTSSAVAVSIAALIVDTWPCKLLARAACSLA